MQSERAGCLHGWQALRETQSARVAGQVPVRLLAVTNAYGPVRVALTAEGLPRLLLPVAMDANSVRFIAGDALRFETVSMTTDNGPGRFIDLRCNEPRLESVFAEVADSIVMRIADGESAEQSCRSTLEEFAELFVSEGDSGPDPRSVQGLMGELLYLDSLVEQDPRAIELWFGTDRARHDFSGGGHAIEIKTISRPESPVTIGSFDQLLAPEGGTLNLRVYELTKASGAARSVADLVTSIAMRCSDPDGFHRKLEPLGFDGRPGTRWSELRFEIGSVREWQVDARFPRITRELLETCSAGLVSVSYAIRPSDVEQSTLDDGAQAASRQQLLASL